jgi:hypothetical protein
MSRLSVRLCGRFSVHRNDQAVLDFIEPSNAEPTDTGLHGYGSGRGYILLNRDVEPRHPPPLLCLLPWTRRPLQ